MSDNELSRAYWWAVLTVGALVLIGLAAKFFQ
jgi:hypothetical protein